jgi:hypothetical protein
MGHEATVSLTFFVISSVLLFIGGALLVTAFFMRYISSYRAHIDHLEAENLRFLKAARRAAPVVAEFKFPPVEIKEKKHAPDQLPAMQQGVPHTEQSIGNS